MTTSTLQNARKLGSLSTILSQANVKIRLQHGEHIKVRLFFCFRLIIGVESRLLKMDFMMKLWDYNEVCFLL